MKKISVLFYLVLSSFVFVSCEQQMDVDPPNSITSKEQIKIAQDATPLSQDKGDITYCGDEPEVFTLWAGQHINAGTVTVKNSDDILYVTVESTEGFQSTDENIKIWVGKDLANMPKTGKGTPIPGQFPVKYNMLNGETTHTFEIKFSEIENWDLTNGCDQNIFIVVHADVKAKDSKGSIQSETAFGGNLNGEGPRWWYYISYKTVCCDDNTDDNSDGNNGGDENDEDNTNQGNSGDDSGNNNGSDNSDNSENTCMDAYAYMNTDNSYCFINDNFSQWGWTNMFTYEMISNNSDIVNFTYKLPLYANANECDLSGATEIGSLELYIEGSEGRYYADIEYVITDSNYKLSEIDLYIGSEKYPKDSENNNSISATDFDYRETNLDVTEFFLPDLVWYSNTYLVAHAKICPK